jgi:16S rRNA (adenine1518-N6/adenine1519-N6)-dimethyltransferase
MSEAVPADGLPALRDVIERHGLAARKSLGQNFLFDMNLTRRIARAAAPLNDGDVVEVGPGPGGLTRALLLEGARHVTAIERDARALPALQEIADHYPNRLSVIMADAMAMDWNAILKPGCKIIANLPYNVGTALLVQWLTMAPWPPPFASLTLMFQKEVAQRITAAPGDEAYGRLAVLAQWRCVATRLFDVNRSAFTPPPKVTSSIVQLVPRTEPLVACSAQTLGKVTAAAFGQRRKMLRSSLKAIFTDVDRVLAPLGIAGTERAENLTVQQFGRLAQMMERQV